MPKPAIDTLRGSVVQFDVKDVYLPQPHQLLEELHGGEVLEGTVVEVSDGGKDGKSFVVIEVDRLRRPCILAVELVRKVHQV